MKIKERVPEEAMQGESIFDICMQIRKTAFICVCLASYTVNHRQLLKSYIYFYMSILPEGFLMGRYFMATVWEKKT